MPTALTYSTRGSHVPNWVPGAFDQFRLGYGYETDDFLVHFFGSRGGLWGIPSGLTVWERKKKSLPGWISSAFNAVDSREVVREVGSVVDGVWRPGLFFDEDVKAVFGQTRAEQRTAEQTLYLLLEGLQNLFLVVEPAGAGLGAYGPKMRELLILACTEVEDAWSHFMRLSSDSGTKATRWRTSDYVRLRDPLFLQEYRLTLQAYPDAPAIRPFGGWAADRPTQTLPWYDAYNRAKHDRSGSMHEATLQRCVEAVAANIALFCVRFSPGPLFGQATPVVSLVNHMFSIELVDCDPATFYVPYVKPPTGSAEMRVCGESRGFTVPWTTVPLVL